MDLAGVVERVGPGVTGFAPGDEVYGLTGGVGDIRGSLAQYAAVDANLIAAKPTSLTMREAAALPLVTITAWEGLVDRARVRAGQKVLVHGGGGGIGHVAGTRSRRSQGVARLGQYLETGPFLRLDSPWLDNPLFPDMTDAGMSGVTGVTSLTPLPSLRGESGADKTRG